jgi:hypothetical protein
MILALRKLLLALIFSTSVDNCCDYPGSTPSNRLLKLVQEIELFNCIANCPQCLER